jgi:hypothetical protein
MSRRLFVEARHWKGLDHLEIAANSCVAWLNEKCLHEKHG